MRHLLVLSVLLSSSAALACDDDHCDKAHCDMQQSAQAQPMPKDGPHAALTVSGMKCQGCANKVETALLQVPGVKAADVDLDTGLAEVAYDGNKATLDALIVAVKGAGPYSAELATTSNGETPKPAPAPQAAPKPGPGT